MQAFSSEEWTRIANSLESHHAIFYKMWTHGRPQFNDSIETAAVEFDKLGNCIRMSINPSFWESIGDQAKLFVVSHEMLHIILNHGLRLKSLGMANAAAANICMDIVVNHALVSGFGFDRELVESEMALSMGCEEKKPLLCWIDNVFDGTSVKEGECFEHYLNLYRKVFGDGNCNRAAMMNHGCLDDHAKLPDFGTESIMENISRDLSADDLGNLHKVLKRLHSKDFSAAGSWHWAIPSKPRQQKKRRWESVVRRWERKIMSQDFAEGDQWCRSSRRQTLLPSDLIVPSELECFGWGLHENSVDVMFFIDTSGSCWEYKERFLGAAHGLSKRHFNTKVFCFDTQVAEISLKYKRVYGGGGTSFREVASAVERQASASKRHPHVFVLTDGYGDCATIERPSLWHWFITRGGTSCYINKKCHIYDLDEFD